MSALRRLLSGATAANTTGGHGPPPPPAGEPGPSPIGTPRLSTSMSFNDMSMGTALDAAELGALLAGDGQHPRVGGGLGPGFWAERRGGAARRRSE